MKKSSLLLAFALVLAPLSASSQNAPPSPAPVATIPSANPAEIKITVERGVGPVSLAIPPAIAPITPEVQSKLVDPFQAVLTGDLGGTTFFTIPDPTLYPKGARPPATKEQRDAWVAIGAQALVDTQIQSTGDQVTVIAEIYDLKSLKVRLARRYSGEAKYIRRIAHTLANDIFREFTGRIGPFLTKIAFVSDRDGPGKKEVYLMDFDGENQRRVTYHNSLSMAPDWSPDSNRLVYQTLTAKKDWVLNVISKDTGEIRSIPLPPGVQSAYSPSVSPDGKRVAFCGGIKGNAEIFTVGLDGSDPQRLTEAVSLDTTPSYAPNGRDLSFTSNRQGTPQIFVMDVDGANVRKISGAGTHNDQAVFSPDGSRLAFSCRNEGEMQICLADIVSGRMTQVSTGAGAHQNPTWSPDGSKLAWEVRNGGSGQIVIANSDGSSMRVVTSIGNNSSPAWSKTLQ